MAKEITLKKEILTVKKSADAGDDEERPKNLRADLAPTDGYGLEVDGKMKSHHLTEEAALKAGRELKTKFPLIQVRVFDAKAQTRTLVELPKS